MKPDYSKGKIYQIYDAENDDIYIGSTTNELNIRFDTHHIFTIYNKNKKACKISLIENYPCNSKRELEEREQYHIDRNDCINRKDAIQNKEDYRVKGVKRSNRIKQYQNSMGGRLDRDNNSLVKIDPYLFY